MTISAERGLVLQHHLTAHVLTAIVNPSIDVTSQRYCDAMRQRRSAGLRGPCGPLTGDSSRLVGVLTPYAFSSLPFDLLDWSLEISASGQLIPQPERSAIQL